MKRLIVIFVASMSLVSCGNSDGVTKDTKADYQLDIKDLTGLGAIEKETERAKYLGKVIELKGFVKGARASKSSANPNKYFFYLVSNMQDDDFTGTIIHTDVDATTLEGKPVTVKGALEYAGAISLKNSAVY